MPNNIPATVTYRRLKIGLIDDSGDKRSLSLRVDNATTLVQARAVASTLGDITSASIYSLELSDVFEANPLASQALDGEQNSVFENVVISFANRAQGTTFQAYIPAPIEAIMQGDTDTVNVANAEYLLYLNAINAVKIAGFDAVSVRYTERREINDSVAL